MWNLKNQHKYNNENNHNDVQTCNMKIRDYIKRLNSFSNACIIYRILLTKLVIVVSTKKFFENILYMIGQINVVT